MKTTFTRFVFLSLAFLFLWGNVTAQKIGFTNVEILLSYMPEAIKANKDIESFAKVLNDRLVIKDNYIESKYSEYEEAVAANKLSPEQRKTAEAELQKLQQELQASAQEADTKVLAKQQELMDPLLQKIQVAIDQVAKEGEFTYILNQTSGSNILYGLETLDVTKNIAKKLGITLPAETPTKP